MRDTTIQAPRKRVMAAMASAVVVGMFALAGCGPTASQDGADGGDVTRIRFSYATGDDSWNSAVDGVVEAYNAQSDGVVVEGEPLTGGSDYATAVRTMDATGNWPAIIDMRDTATYIEAEKLAPIPEEVTSLLQEDTYATYDDGEVYTVPSTANNGEIGLNIIYDKAYFAEHGLEVPTTYDEFISLMEAIEANGDVPLATAAGEVWPSDQLWKPLAAPTFAEYGESGDGYWNAVASGDASLEDLREPLERLQYITDNFVLDGWQSTQDAQLATLLVTGQAIMSTSSAGMGRLNDINKVDPEFDAGMFIIPGDDGTINVLRGQASGTGSGLAISAQAAEDEDEYAAAVDFLEFYYSVEGANAIEEAGVIAPNIVAADEITRNTSIPGAEDYFALLENPNLVWYQNEMNDPDFSAFNTFFRQTRIEMQDGQITLDDAIDQSQDEFDRTVSGD